MDNRTRKSLAGANVQIEGTVLGTTTDVQGYFLLSNLSPDAYRLRASYIGYKSDTVTVIVKPAQVKKITFLLNSSVIELNQVVITGSRQPENLASAASSINVVDRTAIQRRNLLRLDEALQYVPGVTLVGENINIRGGSGYNRLGGNRMLVLLDEVPILTSDLGEANWN
ncbi:TonB-dependent receptor, partial [candidate division KSB1 bacterium]|nr:TonB-dependent receptor [candidate division KSB1 bacterium]